MKKFILKDFNFKVHKRIVCPSNNVYFLFVGVPYLVRNKEDIKFFETIPYVEEFKEKSKKENKVLNKEDVLLCKKENIKDKIKKKFKNSKRKI